jgi:serine/threonine protein phosphatase 1
MKYIRTKEHTDRPLKYGNVWFMDTGGGWEGKLSMMNVDTEEIFQSDLVLDLYPEERGRR